MDKKEIIKELDKTWNRLNKCKLSNNYEDVPKSRVALELGEFRNKLMKL